MNNAISLMPMVPSPSFKKDNARQREEKKEVTEEFSSLGSGALVAHSIGPVGLLVDVAEIGTKLFSYISNNGLNDIFDKTMGSVKSGAVLDSVKDYFQRMMSVNPSASIINLNTSKLNATDSAQSSQALGKVKGSTSDNKTGLKR